MAGPATGYGRSASEKKNGRPEPTGVVPAARSLSSPDVPLQWPATDLRATGKSKYVSGNSSGLNV